MFVVSKKKKKKRKKEKEKETFVIFISSFITSSSPRMFCSVAEILRFQSKRDSGKHLSKSVAVTEAFLSPRNDTTDFQTKFSSRQRDARLIVGEINCLSACLHVRRIRST